MPHDFSWTRRLGFTVFGVLRRVLGHFGTTAFLGCAGVAEAMHIFCIRVA